MRAVFCTIRRKDKHYFPNNVHCELFFYFFIFAKIETVVGKCVLVAHNFVLMAHKWHFETKKAKKETNMKQFDMVIEKNAYLRTEISKKSTYEESALCVLGRGSNGHQLYQRQQ